MKGGQAIFYRILEGVGFIVVLAGVAAADNPWYVPTAIMAAGAALMAIGVWGESGIQRWEAEKGDKT